MALNKDELEAFKESYISYRQRTSELAKNRFLGYFRGPKKRTMKNNKNKNLEVSYAQRKKSLEVLREEGKVSPSLKKSAYKRSLLRNFNKHYGKMF